MKKNFITVTPDSGTSGSSNTISVAAEPNILLKERSEILNFNASGGVSKSVQVIQNRMCVTLSHIQNLKKNFSDEFRAEAKKHLNDTLISIKTKNKVVTINLNRTKKKNGINKKQQQTPRGQLHLETVYGSHKQYVVKEEKVNASFDAAKIATVNKPAYRDALLRRLQENGNDSKKAFTGKNSLDKQPVWLDAKQNECVPEKVKTVMLETVYTVRKPIDEKLNVDKVVDARIRKLLQDRIKEYGNAKSAFANLDENPIWLNKEKGITIKRVSVSGISKAQSLHEKKDKDGNFILDKDSRYQECCQSNPTVPFPPG